MNVRSCRCKARSVNKNGRKQRRARQQQRLPRCRHAPRAIPIRSPLIVHETNSESDNGKHQFSQGTMRTRTRNDQTHARWQTAPDTQSPLNFVTVILFHYLLVGLCQQRCQRKRTGGKLSPFTWERAAYAWLASFRRGLLEYSCRLRTTEGEPHGSVPPGSSSSGCSRASGSKGRPPPDVCPA